MQKNIALASETILDSELCSKNFWSQNIISKHKIHIENYFQKIEVRAMRLSYFEREMGFIPVSENLVKL